MSKNLLIIVTTMILALTFTCCQKTEKGVANSISQEDLDLAQQLTSFINRMNQPATLKSDRMLDINDALWSLEASMNFSFADIPEIAEDVKSDTLAFVLNVENGFCSERNLSALYQEIDIAIQQYCSTLGEHQLMGVDIKTSIENPCEITVSLVSGRDIKDPFLTFGPTDYWRAGLKCGKCGDYNGQYGGKSDAAKELQSKANYSIPKIAVAGGTIYYTDFSEIGFNYGHGVDDNPNYHYGVDDPLMEHMFYVDYPEAYYGWRCIPPDVMNFYLTNLKNFGNSNCPAGKELVSYCFEYDYYIGIPDGMLMSKEFHYGGATYGIRHIKPNPHVTD